MTQLLVIFLFYFFPQPLPFKGLEKGTLSLDFNLMQMHFFGFTLPREHFYLFFTAGMLGLLILLFLATVYGKVFCGWLCPQNTYFELLQSMHQKIKRHYPTYRKSQSLQKSLDLGLVIIFAILTSWNLNRYFYGSHWLFTGYITFTCFSFFLLLVHFLKHRFCKNACPYALIQNTMQGKRALHVLWEDRPGNRCDVCMACVKACYVDLDIKKTPFHADCTHCGACIDACENVYRNKKEPSLLKYTFANQKMSKNPFKWIGINSGTKSFITLLVILLTFTHIYLFTVRPMELVSIRHHLTTPKEVSTGFNLYDVNIKNLSSQHQNFELSLDSNNYRLLDHTPIEVPSLKQKTLVAKVAYIGHPENQSALGYVVIRISKLKPKKIVDEKRISFHRY